MDKVENQTDEIIQAWVEYHKNERKRFQKILREAIKLGYLMMGPLGTGVLNYENSKIRIL